MARTAPEGLGGDGKMKRRLLTVGRLVDLGVCLLVSTLLPAAAMGQTEREKWRDLERGAAAADDAVTYWLEVTKQEDEFVKVFAARQLGLLGDARAVPRLKELVKHKSPRPDIYSVSFEARQAIAQIAARPRLKELRRTRGMPFLMQLRELRSSPSPRVRYDALRVLLDRTRDLPFEVTLVDALFENAFEEAVGDRIREMGVCT